MEYADIVKSLNILKNYVNYYSLGDLMEKTYNMSIEALEKQLPKKPRVTIKEQNNEESYLKKEHYICPNCGKILVTQNHQEINHKNSKKVNRWFTGSENKYCSNCGQAINWKK